MHYTFDKFFPKSFFDIRRPIGRGDYCCFVLLCIAVDAAVPAEPDVSTAITFLIGAVVLTGVAFVVALRRATDLDIHRRGPLIIMSVALVTEIAVGIMGKDFRADLSSWEAGLLIVAIVARFFALGLGVQLLFCRGKLWRDEKARRTAEKAALIAAAPEQA